MAGKYIATEGCELELSSGSATSVKITTPASTLLKINKKGVYVGNLNISIMGFSSASVDAASGSGTLKPTSLYIDSVKNKVVREGDESEKITVTGTKSGSPATDIVTVKIKSAGQSVVKAE